MTYTSIPSAQTSFPSTAPIIVPSNILSKIPSPAPSATPTSIPSVESLVPSTVLSNVTKCQDDEIKFVLIIAGNENYSDTRWTLQSTCRNERVLEGYDRGVAACIKDGCYRFTIFDDSGDGICCDNGVGYYEIYINDELIHEGGEFTFEETTFFGNESTYNQSPCQPNKGPSSSTKYSQIPSHNPSTSPTKLPTMLPTTDESSIPSNAVLNKVTLSFSDFLLQLALPITRRYLHSSHRQEEILPYDRNLSDENQDLSYDHEGLFVIVYQFLYESFVIYSTPYFSGLTISLQKIDEEQISQNKLRVNYKLTGKVSFETNDASLIPTISQVDEYILGLFDRGLFLERLQESDEATLASTKSVNVSVLRPFTSKSKESDNDDTKSNKLNYILIAITICCVCLVIVLVLSLLRIKHQRDLIVINTHRLDDDCSTSSPGSFAKYKNGVFSDCANHSSRAISVDKSENNHQSCLSSISASSSDEKINDDKDEEVEELNGGIDGKVILKGQFIPKVEDQEVDREGGNHEFHDGWCNNENSSLVLETTNSCDRSTRTDSTPRSRNTSHRYTEV